MAKKHL